MKLSIVIFNLLIFLILSFQNTFALQIVSPLEDAVVIAGEKITVIVKPDAGENWNKVLLEIFPMTYNFIMNQYKEDIKIPSTASGKISFSVLAVDNEGHEIEIKRNLFVKMPPDVVLESISIYPEYILLIKLLPDDPQEEKEKYEKRQLYVDGKYSDNVERDLTNSERATMYNSSNNNVAVVSPEGMVTAQSPGTARIRVQNDKHTGEVTVEVLPVKRYPDGRIKIY